MIPLPLRMEAEFGGVVVTCERYLPEHVPDLVLMEDLCFPMPWSEGLLRQEATVRDYAWNLVWLLDGKLKGYTFNWTVLDEMHLLNFAVHPEWQGRGFGGYVLDWMIARAAAADYAQISLEVRETNTPAIGLYRSRGFETVARRIGYYSDNGENALVMVNSIRKESADGRD